MEQALADYLRHLELEKNASAYTVKSYREDLTQAVQFFQERLASATIEPGQVSTRHGSRLSGLASRTGLFSRDHCPPPRLSTILVSILVPARNADVESRSWFTRPAQDKKLPQFLTQAEIDRLLAAPGSGDALALPTRQSLKLCIPPACGWRNCAA